MRKPVKIVLTALAILLVLVVGGMLFLWMQVNSIVKAGIETEGPKMTKAAVALDGVDVSVLSGRAEVRGLSVRNPPGYGTDSSLKAGHFAMDLDTGSLFTDTIVVRRIEIDGAEVTYEMGLAGSNIDAILKNIEEYTGPSQSKTIVEDFTVKNAKVRLSATMLAGKGATLPIGDIHLKDIGKDEKGIPTKDVVLQVVAPLADAIRAAVAKGGKGIGDIGGTAKGVNAVGRKGVEGLKKLFQ